MIKKPASGITTLLFQREIFYVQCPIDWASHTWPLMNLLGAQGDRVGQQGIENPAILLLLLDA